jgi:Tfp pilus assembly protein PilV
VKTSLPKIRFPDICRDHGAGGAGCVWRDAKHGARDARAPRDCSGQGEGGAECVWRDAKHGARDARAPRDCRGLTILEMLVSTAMLAFIVLGLTAMFVQTQKAFKSGIKQTTITDAGRTIIDMIASDLSQLSDPHFTNVYYPSNNGYAPPTLFWSFVYSNDLVQFVFTNNNGVPVYRTNQLEDIFATVQTNNMWLGVGYSVSNWFTNGNGGPIPGVGTLYRFVASSNAPLFATNGLFTNFNNEIGYGTFTNTWFHRIADGVVHLKISAFDADGNEMLYESNYDQNAVAQYPGANWSDNYLQYPVIVPNWTNSSLFVTNYLPHSIDIELGILEPEAFEHARALYSSGANVAASNYLYNAAGQVEIFRQHIIIPAAP